MFDSLLATTLNPPTLPANISAIRSPPAAMGQPAWIVRDKATYPPAPFQMEWGVSLLRKDSGEFSTFQFDD